MQDGCQIICLQPTRNEGREEIKGNCSLVPRHPGLSVIYTWASGDETRETALSIAVDGSYHV